ncbi:hypothetical protein FRC17_006424 [Serendipita sp. 399]|nr:hypothetical protein FRC17_006424 [Serendipita sp. 399]
MEATPDPPTAQQIYQVIQDAASQNHVIAQAASQQLETFKTIPGIFATVQAVAIERNLPLDARLMAIIQFKNIVPLQWRRSQYVAQANAIAMAKIARIDYPRAWPDLGTRLLEAVHTGLKAVYLEPNGDPQSTLILFRALSTLNQVLKELTIAKVPILAAAVLTIHEPLLATYSQATTAFGEGLSPQTLASIDKVNHIRIAHYAFKCLVKGMTFLWQRSRVKGFERAEGAVESFFGTAVNHFITLSQLRIQLFAANLNPTLTGSLTQIYLSRHIRVYGKFFRKTQIFSANRFVNLPNCRELVLHYWSRVVAASAAPKNEVQKDDAAPYPVKFLTQALAIFKDSLAQWSPTRKPNNQETLPKEFVDGAVQLIVTRLLLLSEEDLEEWSVDPEEWINTEESDSDAWEYEIRVRDSLHAVLGSSLTLELRQPCAERVLMTIANQYGDYVTPLIQTYLEQVRAETSTDLPSIIRKDAVYCAVGRCAHRTKNSINFDNLVRETLSAEATNPALTYRIIKRRIAWLFGKWAIENNISGSRDAIFQTLIYLIRDRGEGSDAAVRLTAASAFKECLNSISFDVPSFVPLIQPSLEASLALIMESESQDAKRRVIGTVNLLISSVGDEIVPYMGQIAEAVTVLWQQPNVDIPLRAALLMSVIKIMQETKEHSTPMAPIAITLIQECLSPILNVQMEDDAVELWLVSLRNSVPNHDPNVPDFFQLLPNAVELLYSNLDLLGTICQIIESYLLLDCSRVLQAGTVSSLVAIVLTVRWTQQQAGPLHQAYLQAYNTALGLNVKDVLAAATLMVQLAPSSMWAEAMHNSGFFAKMLISVIQDKAKNENTLVLVDVLQLFARIIMQDAGVFVQLVAASSTHLKQTAEYLMNGFLDQWWAKFDNAVDAPRRKLIALATAELLATGNEVVVGRLSSSEPINIWLDVMGELKEALNVQAGDDNRESPLILYWKAQDEYILPDRLEDVNETLELKRREEVFKHDSIRRTPLKEFIQQKLAQAQQAATSNGVDFQTAWSKVDESAKASLQKEFSLPMSKLGFFLVDAEYFAPAIYPPNMPRPTSPPEPPKDGPGFSEGVKEALRAPAPLGIRLLAVASVLFAYYYTVRPFDDARNGMDTSTKLNPRTFIRSTLNLITPSPPESGSKASHIVVRMAIPTRLLPDSRATLVSAESATEGGLPNAIYHIYVKDDDMQVERPYTPIHGIENDGTMTFWIKKYPGGEVSNWISRLQRGRPVEIRGPVPQWDWKKNEYDEIVMIAGGTGITAFSQLLYGAFLPSRHVTDSINSNTHFTLLHCHRSPQQMPPKEVTEDLELYRHENADRFTEHAFVDRLDSEADDIPRDVTLGTLDKNALERTLIERGILMKKNAGFRSTRSVPNPEKSVMFLVCGPEGLVSAVAGPRPMSNTKDSIGGILGQLGFNPSQVKRL